MSRHTNYDNSRSGGSWYDNDDRSNRHRDQNFEDRSDRSYGSTYNPQSRDNDRNRWRDEDDRYRSNYRNERNRDDDNDFDTEFGYGGDAYPEYKYTRGMWGPAGYGIAMGNYEGRPHYAQSGREYAQSGREYVSRDEMENRDYDYDNNRNRHSSHNRDWENERTRDNDYNRNRNRYRDEDDKNIFERTGEGIRGAWNDLTGDSYENSNRNRYNDRNDNNYNRYNDRNNYSNPYMRNTPEGTGSRDSRYGTHRENWGSEPDNSRERNRARHSYDRRNQDWHW